MYFTEEEAKKKYCCQERVMAGAPDGVAVRCVASECIAWGFLNMHQCSDLRMRSGATYEPGKVGFCGYVVKP